MSTLQAFIGYLSLIPLGATAIGLIARRRAARCWAFLAYVFAAMFSALLVAGWPARFWNYQFYAAKEAGHFALVAMVAVQIWRRTFAALPRARIRVGLLLAAALTFTAGAVLTVPTERSPYVVVVTIEVPRFYAGNLALFAATSLGAWWYRVPLHPFYRAVVGGFGVDLGLLAFSSSALGWLQISGPTILVFSHVGAGTFVFVSAWWAWAAWRPERVQESTVTTLQPWAHSW